MAPGEVGHEGGHQGVQLLRHQLAAVATELLGVKTLLRLGLSSHLLLSLSGFILLHYVFSSLCNLLLRLLFN